jgi:hypothetical protein
MPNAKEKQNHRSMARKSFRLMKEDKYSEENSLELATKEID